jgi:multiple sugar transport system ATP-binding protein
MSGVVLEHVYKRFGETVVVKDVCLEITDGDFVVLVGPSGCGKSTTLRMVAGLEALSEGTIRIGERVVNDLSPRDRDTAMVFQSYALYPHMNVYQNMAFGLELRKMARDEIDRRVQEAARILDIGPLLERKPKQLSGGQRQRVAMGRAIVRQPAVFLFDEPLSNLDAKLRVQMRAEIARLHHRLGTTTIYVTHDQVEAMTLAKNIVVMNDGAVQQVGPPLQVYRSPANTFVAGFIGSPAMNFLDCRFQTATDGSAWLRGGGLSLPVRDEWRAALAARGERPLVFGVRPEHLEEAADERAAMHLTVDVLEPLGAEVHALGTVDGQPITARLKPDTRARVGDRLPLGVDAASVHVFERESGAVVV